MKITLTTISCLDVGNYVVDLCTCLDVGTRDLDGHARSPGIVQDTFSVHSLHIKGRHSPLIRQSVI